MDRPLPSPRTCHIALAPAIWDQITLAGGWSCRPTIRAGQRRGHALACVPIAAVDPPPVTVRTLLAQRDVRRLAGAELCSALGSAMVGVAITFLAYTSTGSLVHTVVIAAAYTLPAAVLGVPAGRLADHHSRRRLLVALWSAKALSYLAMAALSAAGLLTSGWLLATSLVAGSLSALAFPAWEEYEKDLIPPELLGPVNALFSSASSLAALVGALGGAAVIVVVGETAVSWSTPSPSSP